MNASTSLLAKGHLGGQLKGQYQRAQNADFVDNAASTGFGSFEDDTGIAKTVFLPGKRERINIVAILLNIGWPVLLFNFIFGILSFKIHYQNPGGVWLVCLGAFLVCVVGLFLAARRRYQDVSNRSPMWYTFAATSSLLAVTLATVCGGMNFYYNMRPYYTASGLNSYPDVNPGRDYGQMLMDAGKAYFTDGAKLDFSKAIAFKNTDLYCIAPISIGDGRLDHYDFWAVGMDCCGQQGDFRCGQFNNPFARSGLRLLWAEDTPYYRLAVQMAESTYVIQAPHPLFFYWVQDPVAEILEYPKKGFRIFIVCTACHFGFNTLMVLAATVMKSKMGHLDKGAPATIF